MMRCVLVASVLALARAEGESAEEDDSAYVSCAVRRSSFHARRTAFHWLSMRIEGAR